MNYGLVAYGLLLVAIYGIGRHFSTQTAKVRDTISRLAMLERHSAHAASFWIGVVLDLSASSRDYRRFSDRSSGTIRILGTAVGKSADMWKATFGIAGVISSVLDFFLTRHSRMREVNEIRQMLGAKQEVQTSDPMV